MVHVLRRIIEIFSRARDFPLHLLSLDFSKAYDSVYHWAIEECLSAWGVEGKMRVLISSLLKVTCKVTGTRGNADSPWFAQLNGLPTGAPEAPVLFLLLLAWFWQGLARWEASSTRAEDLILGKIEELEKLPVRDLGYADDVYFLGLWRKVTQYRLDYISSCGPSVGLRLNIPKLWCMYLTASNVFTEGTARREKTRSPLPPPPLPYQ